MVVPTADTFLGMERGRTAVVLGNGRSRLGLDLQAIRDDGAVLIGCNAIVRDFPVDYCVGMDTDVVREWGTIKRPGPVYVSVRKHPPILRVGDVPVVVWEPRMTPRDGERMFVGTHALIWAAWLGCDRVFVAGFDADSRNVYENTDHYATVPTRPAPEQEKKFKEGLATVDGPHPVYMQLPPWTFKTFFHVWPEDTWLLRSETTP